MNSAQKKKKKGQKKVVEDYTSVDKEQQNL